MRWTLIELALMLVSIAVIVLLVGVYNIKGAFEALRHAQLIFFAFAVMSFVLFTLAKFIPWTYFVRKLHLKQMSVYQSILMMYAFFGMGMVMTGAAQLLPLRYLDRFRKNARFSSFSMFIAINGTAALSGVAIALISSILISTYVVYLFAVFAVFYAMASLLGIKWTSETLQKYISKKARKSRSKTFKTLSGYVNGLMKYRNFLSQKSLITGILFFSPSILLEGSVLFFVLSGFGQSLPFIDAIFIFTVAVTIGAVSFLPLGIGTMDGTMLAFLLIFGVPGIIAISTVIIFRILNTVLVGITGYACFFILKNHKPAAVENKKDPHRKPVVGLVSMSFKKDTAIGVMEYSTRILHALTAFSKSIVIKPILIFKTNLFSVPADRNKDTIFFRTKAATDVDIMHYLDSEFFPIGLLMHPLRLRRKPAVITVHDLFILRDDVSLMDFKSRVSPLFRPMVRVANFLMKIGIKFAIKHADAIVCVSDQTKKDIKKSFNIKTPMYIIPPIIGKNFGVRKKHHHEKKIIIGHMSSFLPHKNTDLLIRAFRKTKDPRLELRLYGKYLPKDAKDEPRIKYMGFVSTEKLADMYNSFDVFIFPSMREGFGMPIMEAKKCGVPVITYRDAIMPQIVSRNTIRFGDEDELTGLLDGKDWKKVNLAEAIKDSKHCYEEPVAKQLIKVYNSLISK